MNALRIHVGAFVIERRDGLRFQMLVVDHDTAREVFVCEWAVAPSWRVKRSVFAVSELMPTPIRGVDRVMMKTKTGGAG